MLSLASIFDKINCVSAIGICTGRFILFVVIVSALTACGGSRTVVTQDDSADYSAAQTLPPLRKPSSSTSLAQANTMNESENRDIADSSTLDEYVPELNAEIVDAKGDTAKLQIIARKDEAWNYLLAQLKKSNITVHSRNPAAGVVQIGCANIDETVKEVRKQTGWRVVRKKDDQPIYCALKAEREKKLTRIAVLDRAGNEVTNEVAREVFARFMF